MYHVSVHIGQPIVAALEAEGKSFVIEAQQVQDRGLQIVDVDFVFHDAEAQFVGLAVMQAGLHAAAGHPHRETIGVVIAAKNVAARGAAFAERRAAELAAADDQRVVEQAALLQISDQGGDRFIRRGPFLR